MAVWPPDVIDLPDGGIVKVRGAGTGTGDVVQRIGATDTEGLELRVFEATISPDPLAIETAVLTLPANSVVISAQTNVQTALTAGGTTDSYGLGTGADPDKYGASAALTKNTKTNFMGPFDLLASAEDVVLTAAASGTADGDTQFSAGSVRVRIVYWTCNSLDDAA